MAAIDAAVRVMERRVEIFTNMTLRWTNYVRNVDEYFE